MQLEAGKTYNMRDGKTITLFQFDRDIKRPWTDYRERLFWDAAGKSTETIRCDIISEVTAAPETPARTPHKHAAAIKAWADGAEIEFLTGNEFWQPVIGDPCWDADTEYRVKPERRPNVVTWHAVYTDNVGECKQTKGAATFSDVVTLLRVEIDHTDPEHPVLVSATLEKP